MATMSLQALSSAATLVPSPSVLKASATTRTNAAAASKRTVVRALKSDSTEGGREQEGESGASWGERWRQQHAAAAVALAAAAAVAGPFVPDAALAYIGGGPYGREVTRGQDLTGRDYSGLDLRGQDFKTSILRQANFAGANLIGASFFDADLTGTTSPCPLPSHRYHLPLSLAVSQVPPPPAPCRFMGTTSPRRLTGTTSPRRLTESTFGVANASRPPSSPLPSTPFPRLLSCSGSLPSALLCLPTSYLSPPVHPPLHSLRGLHAVRLHAPRLSPPQHTSGADFTGANLTGADFSLTSANKVRTQKHPAQTRCALKSTQRKQGAHSKAPSAAKLGKGAVGGTKAALHPS
ncbi:unnamed protein product [Closterium sp. NIES-65]|nr:unnamed protein product [Closterium sp. NIES-65]